MAHEALNLDGVDAGVEEVGGKGAAAVVGAEVDDAGLAGPTVDQGIDGWVVRRRRVIRLALSTGQNSGPSSRPRTSSHAATARRPPAGRAVRRWRRPVPLIVR
jgi:hypothetical protein